MQFIDEVQFARIFRHLRSCFCCCRFFTLSLWFIRWYFVLFVLSFISFKLNLWLQEHDGHVFSSSISFFEMSKNPSSTTPKISLFIFFLKKMEKKTQSGKKWSIYILRKRMLASVTHRFFLLSFLVSCYWFVFFLFSFSLFFGIAIAFANDNRLLCSICLLMVDIFCSLNTIFYLINPLGIASVLFPFLPRFNFSTFRLWGAESHATIPIMFSDKSLVTHEMGQENMKWKFKFANKNFPQQCEIANNHKEYFHFIFSQK